MNKDTKISSIQLFMMPIGYLFGSTAIMNSASAANQDAWLAYIIAWTGGFLIITLYIWIVRLNPSKDLVEILQANFGIIAGDIITVLYIWYFIHLAAMVFRNFGEFMVSVSYTETPMTVIIGGLACLVAYLVISQLEVIGRVSEVLVPIIPIVVIFTCLSLISHSDFSSVLPLLENGISPVLKVSFSVLTFPFGEIVVFFMIFPFLNKSENLSKVSYLAIGAAGLILFIALFRDLVVLGPNLISELNYSGHATARLIPGISVEPLIDMNFLIGGGAKTSILIYAASMGTAKLLKLDDYKPLVIPVTTFTVVLSIWIYSNIMEMFKWASDIYPYYSIGFQVIIPMILLVISFIRKKLSSA